MAHAIRLVGWLKHVKLLCFVALPHDNAPTLLVVLVNAHLQDIILCLYVCDADMLSQTSVSSLLVIKCTRGRQLTEFFVDLKFHRQPMTVPPVISENINTGWLQQL